MESQPQNPEFRNNPENFHPCLCVCVRARVCHIAWSVIVGVSCNI